MFKHIYIYNKEMVNCTYNFDYKKSVQELSAMNILDILK